MGAAQGKENGSRSPDIKSPHNSELHSSSSSVSRANSKKKSYKSQKSFGPPSYNPELRLFHPDELEEDIFEIGCCRLIYPPAKQVVGLRLVMHLGSAAHMLLLKEGDVSQVEIDFGSYFPLYDTIFLLFRLDQLTYLTLKFSDPVNAKQFHGALECIARMTLKLFKLHFLNSKSVSHISFGKLNEINASFEYTTGFALEFYNCPNFSNDCLSYIQGLIFTMPFLSKFEFTVTDCTKLTEAGLCEFSKGISQLPNIKEFKFGCSEVRGITNKFMDLFNENLLHLKKLTDLTLILPGFNKAVTDKNYRSIVETIENFPNIQNLSLDFSYSKINKAIIDIKTLLKNWNYIGRLSFSFNRCTKIVGDSLIELFEGLKRHPSVYEFELELRECKALNPDIAKHLEESLQTMKGLIKLNLDFSDCPDFSDRALKYITSGLQTLIYLDNLQINLRNCNKISDLGFYYLCFSLEPMTKLKKLTFSLDGMKLLSNLAMEYLSEGLKFANDLESLTLNMYDMGNITEEGYMYLETCLEEKTKIKNFMFVCGLTSASVALSVMNLATSIAGLKELDLVMITNNKGDYALTDDDLNHFIARGRKMEELRRLFISYDRFKTGKVGPRAIQDELYQVIESTVDCHILREPGSKVKSQTAL